MNTIQLFGWADRHLREISLILAPLFVLMVAGRIKAIAEGVENPAMYRFLKEIGCDLAQGFLLSRTLRQTLSLPDATGATVPSLWWRSDRRPETAEARSPHLRRSSLAIAAR